MFATSGGRTRLGLSTPLSGGLDDSTACCSFHRLWVKGEGGGVASITVPDVMQSNGVIQVVSAVLLPK
jgi:hypothetical protein